MKKFTQIAALCFAGLSAFPVANAQDGDGLKATYYSWTEETFTQLKQGGPFAAQGTVLDETVKCFDGPVVDGDFTIPSGDVFDYNFSDVVGTVSREGTNDYFSGRFEGYLKAPVTGQINFTMTGDNGFKLWIKDVADADPTVIDFWANDWEKAQTGAIELESGKYYKIRIDYFEDWGGNFLKLEWDVEGTNTVVPKSALYKNLPDAIDEVDGQKVELVSNASSITIANAGNATISIADLAGKVVKTVVSTQNDATISTSDLAKGIYFAKVGAQTIKFLVK